MSSLFKNPNHVLFKDPVVIMKEIMSWLFKDPINSGLAQLDHAQSNNKKWPKGYKKSNYPKLIFFSKKQLIKFSSTYSAFSFCKILKRFFQPIQSYEDVSFSSQKWPICHEQCFFDTNLYYYFHLPIGLFHCAKFKKILKVDPELWRCSISGPKLVHLPC